jgi:RND family efflux transporter MFP subunit
MMIMKEKKIYLLPALAVVFALASCGGDKKEKEVTKESPVAVTLSTTNIGEQNAIMASGQIESSQSANISTRIMGRITSIKVKAGDHVSKGQLLATISDEDIQAKRAQTAAVISEAEAAYATAQKDYERYSNLYKQQSATARELDNMTLQYNSAKSRLEAARQMRNEVNAMLAYSSLTAPFSGVVTQKLADEGSIANPGMTILTVEQNATLQVTASISESDISNVKVGDTAVVKIKSANRSFTGKIAQLNPSSQFTGGQYIVKISIPEGEKKSLYSGMFVNVSIPVAHKTAISKPDVVMVPQSAIVNRDELTGVYTVSNNNTALLRWIRLGKQYGDKVEVLSGLAKDEPFIATAEGKLYNGVPVTIKGK